jgi:glycosyltransferase involved in cell wall biosynthesis
MKKSKLPYQKRIKNVTLKIIYISHYSELYGANKSLLNLLDGLSKYANIQCEVICPLGSMMDELVKKGIKCYKTKYYTDVYNTGDNRFILKGIIKSVFNLYYLLRLYIILLPKKIDIIHTNSSVTFLGAYLAFLLRKKHVWHIREFVYDDYKLKYFGGEKLFKFWLNKSYAIAISKSIYEKRLCLMDEKKKRQIYNGIISSGDILLNKRTKTTEGHISFAIIGVILKNKNQLEAVYAFSKFHQKWNNSTLYIVGTGDEQYINLLKEFVKQQNIQNSVIFTGYIKEILSFFISINVLLMCSQNEALGRVTVEALSQGVPVIGFNNAGTSEIIIHNYNGLLYNDSDELLNMMFKIYQQPDLYSYLSTNAIPSIEQFTIEKYSISIYNYYNYIIENN